MEFMGQMQEQSELSDSTVEIAKAITLESGMEVGDEPKASKPSQNMDEQLLLEEEEDNKATAKEEPPLPQPIRAPTPLPQPYMPYMPSTTTKVSPNSIHPDPVPPNFLAGSCNRRKKRVRKASLKPFQRIKSKKWMGNV
ncbi:hypothetical protein ACFX1W_037998 [Malus domestica]